MLIKFLNIEITIVTRKVLMLRDIKEVGKIGAIKRYRERYGCSLKEALDYLRKVETEETK